MQHLLSVLVCYAIMPMQFHFPSVKSATINRAILKLNVEFCQEGIKGREEVKECDK